MELVLDRKLKFAGAGAIIFVAALVLAGLLVEVIVLAALFVFAVLSCLYKRWVRLPIGLDLILFCTMLAGLLYGPLAGFIFGALAMVVSDIFGKVVGEWSVSNSIAMAAGGFLAGLLAGRFGLMAVVIISFFVAEGLRQLPHVLIGGNKEKVSAVINVTLHFALLTWLFALAGPFIG